MFKKILLCAAFLSISSLAYSEQPAPENAYQRCMGLGLMAENMSGLIFQYERPEILKAMTVKYPQYAQYIPYMLNIILTPPIMEGGEFRKAFVAQCLKENTKSL